MKRDDAQLLEAPGQHAVGITQCGEFYALSRGNSLEGRLARCLLKLLGDLPLRITLWNGETVFARACDVVADVRIANWSTLFKLVIDPESNFGDAYSDGSIGINGDLVKLVEVAYCAMPEAAPVGPLHRLARWLHRPRSNTVSATRENIHQHYDLGNEFYQLWLDRQMLYTCAYFPAPDISLEQAQVAKMDHVCRKLRLRPGDTVVEAGCGWGALALHMATRYGARVRAFNISHEQIAYARTRAHALGPGVHVQFIEDDYRNISGRYDAFVSIGMLEHVGRDHYHELGRVINHCLQRNGRGLLHSIGQNQPSLLNPWIEMRIFPGAYPPTLREMMAVLEPWQFSVLDVENLRPHYALTLKHWLQRFEDARERVREMYGEKFIRAWRLYLAGSQAAFNTGKLQLFQVLFTRPSGNDAPWTRGYLYKQ